MQVVVESDVTSSREDDQGDSPFDYPINLAYNFGELRDGLVIAVRRGDLLNVTFAAAGMLQILDDAIAHTSSTGGRVRSSLSKSSPLFRRLAFSVTRAWRVLRSHGPVSRRRRWEITRLRNLLRVIAIGAADGDAQLENISERISAYVDALPAALRDAIARIPSSFRSFDQHPADFRRLVTRFAETHTDFARPIVVVGVRTSGVYVAPFVAAYLRQAGFTDVLMLTARSEQPLYVDDAVVLREMAKRDALVVITDDPPSSGYALDSVARSFESYGVGQDSIHLLLAVLDVLPDRLTPYESTILLYDEWSIHTRLSANAVRLALESFLAPVVVKECVIVELPRSVGRSHQQARVVATVEDGYGTHELTVLAEGTGLGYFGDHDRVISEGLGGMPPDVLGVSDGILYREWLPEDAIHTPNISDVVSYIARRSEVFREPVDRSLDAAGSQPVWEVASEQLSRVYGKYWPLARLLFVDRLVKRLVRSKHLAVPDGAMQTQRWFTVNGNVRKVDVSARTFGNLDLMTYDPAYDAVSFAVDHGNNAEEIRDEYSRRVEPLSDEKWLLYELVRLWDDRRLDVVDRYEVAEGRGKAMRRYLSNALLRDVRPNTEGPLVALDVDGVIETEVFGFKSPTPSSVMAIRALILHGYQPVVVTGRCVDDVQQLRQFFRLSGGVAEYGSALVLSDGSVQPVVDDEHIGRLQRLRELLQHADGVHVDERYQFSVRASSLGNGGRLQALDESIADVIDDGFTSVTGNLQTDVIHSEVNKGNGTMRLVNALHADRIVLAVGDTDADVSLFEVAERGATPAHGSKLLKSVADSKARAPYQVGLAEIVSKLIGHRPGTCKACSVADMSAQTKAVLALLQTTEGAKSSIPWRTLKAMRAASRIGRVS